jgi:hypothetical protein
MASNAGAHDRQRAVLSTRLAAGHRGIHERDAMVPASFVQFPCNQCRRRGVVDEDAALAHAGESTIVA